MKRKKKRKHRPVLTERDCMIFHKLWHWKILPMSFLKFKYFKNADPRSAYRRLRQLEAAKYIQFHHIPDLRGGGFSLEKKGYEVIREGLPELSNQQYGANNPRHDLPSTLIMIGEWYKGIPSKGRVCPEQVLKGHAPDLWPSWVKLGTDHRPDGLWLAPSEGACGQKVICLEVEASDKSMKRYLDIAMSYSSLNANMEILWVVHRRNLSRKIEKAFERYSGEWAPPNISFLLIDDFLTQGWNARVFKGSLEDKTLMSILCPKSVSSPSNPSQLCNDLPILNLNKSGYIPNT